MYRPKLSFLLIYESHNMRHTSFLRVDGLSTDPQNLERHIIRTKYAKINRNKKTIKKKHHGYNLTFISFKSCQ